MKVVSTLKIKIREAKDKNKQTQDEIVRLSGYSTNTNLNKVLNKPNPKGEFASFNSLIKITERLFPNEKLQLMSDHCETLDPKKQNARCALEYASMNRLNDLSDFLIENMLYCGNVESEEWAKIYEINKLVSNRNIDFYDAISKINQMKLSTPETIVFSKIVLMYAYYFSSEYDQLFKLVKIVEHEINNISEEFIKESYQVRLGLVLTGIFLAYNRVDEARKYATDALNSTDKPLMKATLHLHMGNSYLFESYDKAMDHLNKAKVICDNTENSELKMIEVKRSLNFVSNYWSKNPSYLNYESSHVSDVHEVAFYHIRKDNFEKALELLNSLNINEMNESQKGFHYFYRGLVSKNEDCYHDSVMHFQLSGDKFYRWLPLIELKRLGLNERIIRNMSL